ncbi:MAG: hypothetical protein RIR86_2889, partial [Acidobacteriota bacterium]
MSKNFRLILTGLLIGLCIGGA